MSLKCTHSLVISQPYDQARRRTLAALRKYGLQVAFEFDVANGILRSAGVSLPKSSVIGVGCPYQLLEAFVADRTAAVFLPLHVVLSELGSETLVRILSTQVLRAAGVAPAISIPVHRTLGRIHEALALIGARSATSTRKSRRAVGATGESVQGEAWA
jgi:uncharacterized protein (DUF302 family)